jgi:UDP-N-acetylmuramate--alanine ligase
MADDPVLTPESMPRVHIVGGGGAGMSGLAKLLSQQGHIVTASDLKPSRFLDGLSDLDIETWVGHRPDAVIGVDLVAASSAVPAADPEIRAAQEAGVLVWSRPDLLDALTDRLPAVGFTGTHGKTTSTAMAITAVRHLGLDPTFLVGGEMVALNTGAHLGTDAPFLLEADEAFGTFRRLHLTGLAVTNIEADHLDYYGNVAALEEAFSLVAGRADGPVVGCIDDPGVRRLARRRDIVSYGRSEAAEWRLRGLEFGRDRVEFILAGPEQQVPVRVPSPGSHVALNAAGVLALLGELGYDLEAAARGLGEYAGVKRRFDVRARIGGVTIVDDYAHHPTEIAATIAAGRSGGWDRVWAVFQPHRYTRTAELAPEFGKPLATADHVIVTDVYAAGERPQPGVSGRLVAEATAAAGGDVEYVPSLSDVAGHLGPLLSDGDVVLLLGAGDVNSLAEPLASRLRGLS